jgi:beta-glucuronidase
MRKTIILLLLIFDLPLFCNLCALGQTAMMNVTARHITSLNGKWQAIVDPFESGKWKQIWKDRKPEEKTDFVEYSFNGSPLLNVPGDFNSQMPELSYYEGTVWYKKTFPYSLQQNKRLFIYFGAVNYIADVYLNGYPIGSHEGGFTPFQFEITDKLIQGDNSLIVMVNNKRHADGLPGNGYDWFNYGGITRDVMLIETADAYIKDYAIGLRKNSVSEISGWVKMDGLHPSQWIEVRIPELNIVYKTRSDEKGFAEIKINAIMKLWSPDSPSLYKVTVLSQTDTVTDEIGFRQISVRGSRILLNGKPVFLKGVNIHEEIPQRSARAWSESDALVLLSWARELGCNMVRLIHYPHNENMVKLAEKMGMMVWEELPVYQGIKFTSPGIGQKMDLMLNEMIARDRNRCGVIIWSISNETNPSAPNRNEALIKLSQQCRQLDSTRLITSSMSSQHYENNTFELMDPLYPYFDIMAINEYVGWYIPWQGKPGNTKWNLNIRDKPVFVSEFGGEALFGNTTGSPDEAFSWREEYQEQIYKDQVELFGTIPNLCGVCPWILVDYRSPVRMHPVYQQGWNRKGLLSEGGEKKKAWFIMNKYFEEMTSDKEE